MTSNFITQKPNIVDNILIRTPQKETFVELSKHANSHDGLEREVGVILPVGCGKSGCITLAPFAYGSKRTLVIAPGISIASQLEADFNPSNAKMFYRKCKVLVSQPYPEPVIIKGTTTNITDLEEADVVITNIQQLQREDNRWIQSLPDDFFDLILFDEGHHSVASSWEALKDKFKAANIVNFSATPLRSDGQMMAGKILYSFPIYRAIQDGYVKRLKAVQLNPRTLRYVRRSDSQEIEVSLEEVRRLGEEEADFRRSIVTSTETLNTIVDTSIHELERLRNETGDERLKIIASALNYEHCRQIVQAYRSRGCKAEYVHSLEDSASNLRVMDKLKNHELDVIIQVRKLGEGFDHPQLSVAAVFSIFSNLSPFVQFVGRIMRVIEQNAPGHVLNQGVVVFHAGANIAKQWADFQTFSEADQEFFNQLLPLEGIDPTDSKIQREYTPSIRPENEVEVKGQSEIQLEELHLLQDDEVAAIKLLQDRGIISENFDPLKHTLQPIPVTKVAQRQAMRASLDMRVHNEVAKILSGKGINPTGYELDRKHLGRHNLIILKAAIDRQINAMVGKGSGKRSEFSRAELDKIDKSFNEIVKLAISEVFNVN